MLKVILPSRRFIPPFNEPARDLRIHNKPLWRYQRDVLMPYTGGEVELPPASPLPQTREACLVYRDNLFFDPEYIAAFLEKARSRKKASRAAFTIKDPAFREHCLPLSASYSRAGELYLANLWYYPNGPQFESEPLVIDLGARQVGYYRTPPHRAGEAGDLLYQVPLRSLIAIDAWVHVLTADIIFGLFGQGARFKERFDQDSSFKLEVLMRSFYERKPVLECSKVVSIGQDCTIDPTAVIRGPAVIGEHVTIGAGALIENCIIGNNVTISQGCQLALSVVGDGTFLPFRASLFMTTVMENSMVAQNTYLQMAVVGRNSFIGAGNTFMDFDPLSEDLQTRGADGELQPVNRPVLGGCVGHNCRIGSGMVVYPACTIESDVVLMPSPARKVITHDISYEESDHHALLDARKLPRLYPRFEEKAAGA